MSDELMLRPATELARLVRHGELSASELVGASLERIDALNPDLNAFVHVDEEGARAAAAEIDPGDERPFAGVPIAIKDGAAVAGLPFSAGSQLFGDFVPGHDAFFVRRLREAGFVIVGKTNLPEFGILPVTEPRRWGPTRNPWDTDRTPGGSSGGAAAAVAGGMVPIAHGSDGGGSIRIPAACCGLVGLKPSRGRISRGPEFGSDFLVQDGVLSRTVEETAELLHIMAGYEPGDSHWAPPPDVPHREAHRRDPGRLRVLFTNVPPVDTELDSLAKSSVHDAAELLEGRGHDVEELDSPPWAGVDLLPVFTSVFGSHIAQGIAFGSIVSGQEPTEELIEPLSLEFWRAMQERGALEYMMGVTQLEALTRQLVALWERCDVLLLPALAERPVRIGEIDSCSDEPWESFVRSGRFTPFTALFNATGQPAISLPLFHGDDGLPLAVQFAGRPGDETTLLALGAQLEAERPWAERVPRAARGATGIR